MSRNLVHISMAAPLLGFLVASCAVKPTTPTPSATEAVQAGLSLSASRLDVTPLSLAWQLEARARVGANNLSPLAAARVYAALSVAQYRAVMSIDDPDIDGELPNNGVGAGGRSNLEARRGAVAGASAEILSFFFPAGRPSLEELVAAQGSATPGEVHPWFTAGLAAGRGEGAAVAERCRNDRFTTPWTGTVPTGPGVWIANGPPAGATFGGVKTYFLTSSSQFRSAAPPAFDSEAFLADLEEVKTSATNRTPEQQADALYWNFPTGTFTPPGYWNTVAAEYVQAYSLNERAATRTFALMHAAMMDALIACWETKYHYWTLRPSQAASIPLSFGLPNHPSYPSGHSCVSAAAATVLSYLFPDRAGDLSGQVADAGLSRILAGIHYRFDIAAGNHLGIAVGRWAIDIDQAGLHEALMR